MRGPLGFHWYRAAPIPLDVVWCHWPLTEGGFKNRPCLVNRVFEQTYEDHTIFSIEVAYGTSKVEKKLKRNVGSFVISKYESLQSIPLYQATRFELLTLQILPWTEEWFPTAPGRSGPIVGHMTSHEIVRLDMFCQMKKMMIAALDAGTSESGVEITVPRSPAPAQAPAGIADATVLPIARAVDRNGDEIKD